MDTCAKYGLIDRRRKINNEQQSKQDNNDKLATSRSLAPRPIGGCESVNKCQKVLVGASIVASGIKTTDNHLGMSHNEPIGNNNNNNTMVNSEAACYHHFALLYDNEQLENKLSDVLFVLVAGSSSRVEAHAKYLEQEPLFQQRQWSLERLTNKTGSRFDLFKLGPVLLANHGIGYGSISIVLHELFLMCRASNRLDKITLIRFGTCGGIGVEPGTVCITNKVYDSLFNSYLDWPVCGKIVRRQSIVDSWTSDKMLEIGKQLEQQQLASGANNQQMDTFKVVTGGTLSTNDFYEEQGRTMGAICDHTVEDKMQFLTRAQQLGIVNMEMEANLLVAMCHKLRVKHGVACVALTNRLANEKILVSHQVISGDYEMRLFRLNAKFIEHIILNGS